MNKIQISRNKLLQGAVAAIVLAFGAGLVWSLNKSSDRNEPRAESVCGNYEEGSILWDAARQFGATGGASMEESLNRKKNLDELQARIMASDGYAADTNCVHILVSTELNVGSLGDAKTRLAELKTLLAASREGYVMEAYAQFLGIDEMQLVIEGREEQASKLRANDPYNGQSRLDEKDEQ